MSDEMKILIVEDEPDIGNFLEYALQQEGFNVALARNGSEAIDSIRNAPPDLVLLDLMLPDMSGLDVLKMIRHSEYASPDTRVIVLTARKDEVDRILGFELGADDYVTKPFSPRELVLRVRAVLHRNEPQPPQHTEETQLSAGPIEIDLERHKTRVEGREIYLTLTEFKLLTELIRGAGRVRTRQYLLSEVWGYESEVMGRTVDTHVRRLRNKLGAAALWLETIRGVGYRIQDPELSL